MSTDTSTPVATPATAVELVPDRLYALGGMLELDGRVGWVTREARGWQPLNCYLVKEGERAALVDTGAPYFETQILLQLADALPPAPGFSLFISRAEFDAMGNVVALSQSFDVKEIIAGGNPNPFDALDQVTVPGKDSAPRLDRIRDLDRSQQHIDLGGGRELGIITSPIRMLTCCWSYDPGTKTLFTADFFGKHILQSPDYDPRAPEDDGASLADFADTLQARYWWLKGSHTDKLITAIDAVFQTYDVERIAPTHGCVVTGKHAVQEHYDLYVGLLRELGTGVSA